MRTMIRLFANILTIGCLIAVIDVKAEFLIGAAQMDITPPLPVDLPY